MGSFNVSCALTQDVIKSKDEAVLVLITPNHRRESSPLTCYNWDRFSPIPILLEGTYNTYGSLDDIRFFNSGINVSGKAEAILRENLVALLKENTVYNTEYSVVKDPQSLEDLLDSRDWAFKREPEGVVMLRTVIKGLQDPDSEIAKHGKEFLAHFNVDSIEAAQEKLKKHEGSVEKIPLHCVFMKKEAVRFLLDNFKGHEEVNEEEDDLNYYLKVQSWRARAASVRELKDTIDFQNGTRGFAGENLPLMSFEKIMKRVLKLSAGNKKADSKVLSQLDEFHARQVLDFDLINEYMNLLGKTWQPSMTLSEEIQNYGHKEAFETQQRLLEFMVARDNKLKL